MTANTSPDETVVADVLRLLTEFDPYFLEPGRAGGVPADEYAPEADPIADLLAHGDITAPRIDAVWVEWFGEPLNAVVGSARVDEFVAALNRLMSRGPE